MRIDGFNEEADLLVSATVHWLRHTGISKDINEHNRPIKHVGDDAGHRSVSTTYNYVEVELRERAFIC